MNDIVKSVSKYTIVRMKSINQLIHSIDRVLYNGIEGDMVECGVYKGGLIMAMALRLQENGSEKFVWGYDRFKDGMTEADDLEVNSKGVSGKKITGQYACPIEEVKKNLENSGCNMDYIRLIEGDVSKTLLKFYPEKISLLRIDVDFYEPTKQVLKHLYPRVTTGGLIIFDDYDCWSGCKRAVDEFFGWEILKGPKSKRLIKGREPKQ